MAKIGTLGTISDLTATTTATTVLNQNFAAITTAFQNTYSLDGSMPDQLQATMDANSNRIVNLPSPISTTEPVTLNYLNTVLTTGTSLSGLTGVAISAAMNPVVTASTIAAAQAAFFGGVTTIGPTGSQLILNSAGTAYNYFPLQLNWTPISNGNPGVNSGGIILIPIITPANLTNSNAYCQCYTAQIGQVTPIASGTKGAFSGYECNITTNQTSSDVAGGGTTGHAFGATITCGGSAEYDSADLTIIMNGAGICNNVNSSIACNNGAADCTNINVSSIGSQRCNFAFQCSGSYNAGLALNGNAIINCTSMSFSAPNTTTVLYTLNGSLTDILRIQGGGTINTGGLVIYTYSGTGNAASFYVQNNSADAVNLFSVGPTGTGAFKGTLSCAGGTNSFVYTTSLGSYNAAQTATLTNAPTAGNPTKWAAINDNGTTRYHPLW